jgi:glycosyltransferase involved in cell wall biosynthesis
MANKDRGKKKVFIPFTLLMSKRGQWAISDNHTHIINNISGQKYSYVGMSEEGFQKKRASFPKISNKGSLYRYWYIIQKYSSSEVYLTCQGDIKSLFFSKIFNKKIVTVLHGDYNQIKREMESYGFLHRFLFEKIGLDYLLKKSDAIIAISNFCKKSIPKKLHYKVKVIPHGVDYNYFKPKRSGSKGQVLYVGLMSKVKRPHIVLEVARHFPELKFIMVGGVPKRKEDNDLLGRSAPPNVEFKGKLSHSKLKDLYLSSDLLLFPTTYEGFGLVTLEANACNIPVVCYDFGGPGEIIEEGKNGFKVKFKEDDENIKGFVKAVKKAYLYMDTLRKDEGIRNYAKSRYSWKISAESYRKVIENTLY